MTPAAILSQAAEIGVTLTARAGTVYATPPGLLPPPLVAEIRASKQALLDVLSAAPARVLPFDPDRRRRTEQRLAGRPCPDCQVNDWYVSPRGDATCQTCARRRAATTPTRTDDVPAGGAA